MEIKLKPIPKHLTLLSKGQQKNKEKKKPSNGKKAILGFDKHNDIMLPHTMYSFSFALSEENKPAFSQRAGTRRPSLWIFKGYFTKY